MNITLDKLKTKMKALTQKERDELSQSMREYEHEIKPRFSCKRGDVIKFWSEWKDFRKAIVLGRIPFWPPF